MRKTLLFALLLVVMGLPLAAGAWNRIDTEHTTIIFEERDAPYAQSIALFADEVLLDLASLLDHLPKRKVAVILSGRPAVANGMYSPFPASIILYLSSPTDRFLGSRSASWLRSLYTHELTHYLHLTSPIGPAKYLWFFGPEVPSMNTALMPLWWVEGITTYTESEYAQGGRGDSPLFALTWQSPMLQDSLWKLSQGRYNSAFPPPGRIYSTGYLMVDFLMRTYGKESFERVNKSFVWFPFFGLNDALKKETGFSSKALFALAIEEQQALLPQSTSLGVQFSPSSSVGDHYLPYNTDLGLIGYSNTHNRGGALVRYTPDGGVEELKSLPFVENDSLSFTSSQAVFSFVWSDPFHRYSLPLAPASYSDLMLYHFESDSFTRITQRAMLSHPLISEDGEHLVAIQRTGDRYTLVRIDPSTGSSSLLYDNKTGSLFEPVLAEDNTVVVVAVVEGNSSLVAIDAEGRATVLVPPTRSEIRSPSFSDGKLLFVSDDTGFLALYSYEFATGDLSLILSDPQGVLSARFEGDALLYETYKAEGVALKRVDRSRLSPVAVTLQGPLQKEPLKQREEEILYTSTSFVDYLRFNLVLPFPFVSENKLQPGVWLHSQSLLRQQKLIAQVGWDIENASPVGNLDYLYNPGPFSLGLNFSFAKEKRATVRLSFPLLYKASLYNFKLLSLQGSFALITQDSDLLYSLSSLLGYQVKARPRPKDFFGAHFGSILVGVQSLGVNAPFPAKIRLLGSFSGQTRLFSSSQMLGIALDAVTDNTGSLDDALLYEGFSTQGLDGDAKTRLTVRYHIPFGLLDQPIPYGGLTGLGLTLSAQSAFYVRDASVVWDEQLVFAGRVSATAVVGSGLAIKPFAALAYRVGDGKFSFSIGLNGGALVVTKETLIPQF